MGWNRHAIIDRRRSRTTATEHCFMCAERKLEKYVVVTICSERFILCACVRRRRRRRCGVHCCMCMCLCVHQRFLFFFYILYISLFASFLFVFSTIASHSFFFSLFIVVFRFLDCAGRVSLACVHLLGGHINTHTHIDTHAHVSSTYLFCVHTRVNVQVWVCMFVLVCDCASLLAAGAVSRTLEAIAIFHVVRWIYVMSVARFHCNKCDREWWSPAAA